MSILKNITLLAIPVLLLGSCVSKKKFQTLQTELDAKNKSIQDCKEEVRILEKDLATCESEKNGLKNNLASANDLVGIRSEQIDDLKAQLDDLRKQRDVQVSQVEGLTELSQTANKNIEQTLSQLEKKDDYIQLLMAAKNRTDSINLALAVNLKSVLDEGLDDEDVEIKVDKTVVYINLSDKMLYTSGSATITDKANEVLGKIAKIVESRPDVEVMVEGYTDNVPIKNSCMTDNWDLSVKRATSVVRALQNDHNISPDRLIAAGRGEYLPLATNETAEGRATNRRTRIIILPKLDQFYDLLNPEAAPE